MGVCGTRPVYTGFFKRETYDEVHGVHAVDTKMKFLNAEVHDGWLVVHSSLESETNKSGSSKSTTSPDGEMNVMNFKSLALSEAGTDKTVVVDTLKTLIQNPFKLLESIRQRERLAENNEGVEGTPSCSPAVRKAIVRSALYWLWTRMVVPESLKVMLKNANTKVKNWCDLRKLLISFLIDHHPAEFSEHNLKNFSSLSANSTGKAQNALHNFMAEFTKYDSAFVISVRAGRRWWVRAGRRWCVGGGGEVR